MDISCAFAPTPQTPDHIALAEQLGYKRAWAYDTPALQLDVWMTLARAAERTTRIGLGPATLIASLRHVVATAAAVAALYDLAPGRVSLVFGPGFTGRVTLGQRPLPWSYVTQYVRQLRALLAGEMVEVEGGMTKMLHGPGQAPARPIHVPILLAASGPKGQAAARELADGVFTLTPTGGFDWSALMILGTVLEPGESPSSPRVMAAAGPGAALLYHSAFEQVGAQGGLMQLPNAAQWLKAVEAFPERERYLHIHEGHLTFLNGIDAPIVTGELIASHTFTGEADVLRARLEDIAKAGTTEVAFQPAGPDIPRELTAFAKMAGIA
ncbi:MAG: LLM class flavin-dependent oxidoreductase [Ktedonobacteraceae bacterium]|nr:LLM class flavin-dependent oxidoreductase [Ktedonobacteraceae bacterium]